MDFSLQYLPQTAFGLFLIFSRIGPLVMMLPAIGEHSVPMQSRLAFAVLLTICLYPVVIGKVPEVPTSLFGLLSLSLKEAIIGFAFGSLIKLIASGLQVAGNVISFQSGLSFAQTADPMTGLSDTVFSSFLMMLGTLMVLMLDLHHLLIGAMYDSYMMFPPGEAFSIAPFSQGALKIVAGRLKSAFKCPCRLLCLVWCFFLVLAFSLGLFRKFRCFSLRCRPIFFLGSSFLLCCFQR